jgi:arylsulfatase A-like enzyme
MVAVDEAMQWMEEKSSDENPFLAVVWFGSPHSPHRAAEADRKIYDDQPSKLQHFYGEITGMDTAFGKLRDGLTTMGLRENTVLWYCSDNGALPKIGSSGGSRGYKGKVYEGGLLVPAILEWPAVVPAHRVTQSRCNTCDIYPTLLEIAGVKIQSQPTIDGISLLPLIRDEESKHATKRVKPMGFWDYTTKGISTPSDQWMEALYAAQQKGKDLPPDEASVNAAKLPDPAFTKTGFAGHAAWIDGDWKLHRIEDTNGDITWELYNLKNDRVEANDVATQSAEVAERMKKPLLNWLSSVVDSLNGEDY